MQGLGYSFYPWLQPAMRMPARPLIIFHNVLTVECASDIGLASVTTHFKERFWWCHYALLQAGALVRGTTLQPHTLVIACVVTMNGTDCCLSATQCCKLPYIWAAPPKWILPLQLPLVKVHSLYCHLDESMHDILTSSHSHLFPSEPAVPAGISWQRRLFRPATYSTYTEMFCVGYLYAGTMDDMDGLHRGVPPHHQLLHTLPDEEAASADLAA